ncbi:MAG TPA: bifunctional phosphopantothenoylcysteine decarboxylase/phosphopantothenate--cysteine ligase CoaBC [Acidiferrobacteraceae bacterium]|nr:bifunctional phosphopantothenoylcysteine decarboxylase/phosphopantothenate--cysteine ligase CoaBC [Acidiferrobacteraceae bacterium]
MATLSNKRILVGVTGGIAAYKAADLIRRLRERGAEVRVVMTQAASRFITPLTLQAISGHPVHSEFLDTGAETAMGHIELARWADLVLVAPAGADFLARLAQGRADDLLATLCLATKSPVAVAPAMNQQMWANASTQNNLISLKKRGVTFWGPDSGSQACGETGPGRMLEPAELAEHAAALFQTGSLDGLQIMVTAGPTWEPIDPVRGLSNRSSGKMGYAVAQAAMEAGAQVILVSGPTTLVDPDRIQTLRVATAQQMHDTVHTHIHPIDIFIGVAAVADYRPIQTAARKIKKSDASLSLELVPNPDILASVAALDPAPYTVGFAAETNDLEAHARKKLEAKKLDLIAANPVGDRHSGFESDLNQLTLIDQHSLTPLPLQTKSRLARELISEIAQRYHEKNTTQNTRPAHRQ